MNSIVLCCILLTLLSAGICLGVVIHTKSTFRQLNRLLQLALSDQLVEARFDETSLSQIEAKLYRFLISNKISHAQLTQKQQQVEGLISDISHQTKTPIANILLYTQLLLEEPELSDTAHPLTEEIRLQSEKLDFLIQSLMKTSRLETGIVQTIPKQNYLLEMLEEVVSLCVPKACEKSISICLDCVPELSACFDSKWTSEACLNLLDNAVKYAPDHTNILVRVQAYELFCRIDIMDQGYGISEEEIPKIFGRFYRGEIAAQQEGVGIGLHLARQIVTSQGGYIRVRSKLGEGSTFSVFLPVSEMF